MYLAPILFLRIFKYNLKIISYGKFRQILRLDVKNGKCTFS